VNNTYSNKGKQQVISSSMENVSLVVVAVMVGGVGVVADGALPDAVGLKSYTAVNPIVCGHSHPSRGGQHLP